MNKELIQSIVSKEYNKAKELFTESMNERVGVILEAKLEEYAPTLFEAKKLDKVDEEDADIDNDGDTDKSDDYLKNRRKIIGNKSKK